jgi:hypothetical protein
MIRIEVSFSEPLLLHYSLKSKIKNELRFCASTGRKNQTALCTTAYFKFNNELMLTHAASAIILRCVILYVYNQ